MQLVFHACGCCRKCMGGIRYPSLPDPFSYCGFFPTAGAGCGGRSWASNIRECTSLKMVCSTELLQYAGEGYTFKWTRRKRTPVKMKWCGKTWWILESHTTNRVERKSRTHKADRHKVTMMIDDKYITIQHNSVLHKCDL